MDLPDLFALLPRVPRITVVDVGAMSLGEGTDPYQPLIDAGVADIIGFEPVEEEFNKLQAQSRPGRRYLPYAIGDGTTQTFHICNYAMTSSLLRPNHAITDHFTNLTDCMKVVRTVEIKTHRLDDLPEVRKIDFFKIDIQGAELQVFNSARHVLAGTLMVQTEVEFIPLYIDQPLFGDIDTCLRGNGMMFHRFDGMCGRPFKPIPYHHNAPGQTFSQGMWCDAFFIRDFRTFDSMGPDSLLKMAVLGHYVSNSFDLVFRCLAIYDRLMSTDLAPRYIELFSQQQGSSA